MDKIPRVMDLVLKHGQTYGLIPRTGGANPMEFARLKTQSEYEAKIITPEQCFKILPAMPQPERTAQFDSRLLKTVSDRRCEIIGVKFRAGLLSIDKSLETWQSWVEITGSTGRSNTDFASTSAMIGGCSRYFVVLFTRSAE